LSPQFDGVYFYPDKNNPTVFNMDWFNFVEDTFKNGEKLDATKMGDCYYVVFIENDKQNLPKITETFETIFIDVDTYLSNLAGSTIRGLIVRKTTKSGKWVDNYRKNLEKNVRITKLYNIAKSVFEEKIKNTIKENEDA